MSDPTTFDSWDEAKSYLDSLPAMGQFMVVGHTDLNDSSGRLVVFTYRGDGVVSQDLGSASLNSQVTTPRRGR